MTTIAVMQPYFFPYAGYFRLFASADTFVILDCVQLPRPGWVHRNRFATVKGDLDWLTLPLAKASYTTPIKELRLREGAKSVLESALRRFPLLQRGLESGHPLIARMLALGTNDVTEYLHGLLADLTQMLDIEKPMVRSSSLGIDPALRGQDRVIAIVRALGGNQYVNAPGGRHLYESDAFRDAGIRLRFLSSYGASMDSILSRLLTESAAAVSEEIRRETVLLD